MAFLSNLGKLFYTATVFLVLTADNSGVFGYHRGGSKQNGIGGSGTCKYSEFECNDNSGCYTDAEKYAIFHFTSFSVNLNEKKWGIKYQ